MRVALTGAGGFLGGAVLNHIVGSGHEVVALSSSLDAVAGAEVVRWEATQSWERSARALIGVDVLIHAAAHIPRHHRDAREARRCVEVNALGTHGLLQACTHAAVRRLIYVSGANVLSPRAASIMEDDPYGCEYSPYYLGSKVLGEIYVRAAKEVEGLIVRPSSLYGPGMGAGVIRNFVELLLAGSPIRVQDGGRFRSDYVWCDDVAALVSAAVVGGREGVVNLGSGRSTSVLEVARLLSELLGTDSSLIEIEAPVDLTQEPGFAAVDITRARDWFGFSPTALPDGLARWLEQGVA